MSQIEIRVLKQGISSKRILSCSLFKMSSGYRDFSKYETYFRRFLEQTQMLKDFEVRVYVDTTTQDFCLQAAQPYDTVSIYHFDCPQFREGDGHKGTFGVFPRFLPLFEKGHDIVWITDIDVPDNYLDTSFVDILLQSKAYAFLHTYACYARKPWAQVEYPILAGSFLSRMQFPKQLMTRFLNNLLTGKYNEIIESINDYNKRKSSDDIAPYGIDEYFMNSVMYTYIANHQIPVVVYKNYSIDNIVRFNANLNDQETMILVRYYRNPSPELFRKTKDIFDRYSSGLLDSYPCVAEYIREQNNFTKSFVKVFKTKLITH